VFLHSEAFLVDPSGGHSYIPQQALVCQYGGIRADDEEGTPCGGFGREKAGEVFATEPSDVDRYLHAVAGCGLVLPENVLQIGDILICLSCEAEKLSRPVGRVKHRSGRGVRGLFL
jgi:hypothetical protein